MAEPMMCFASISKRYRLGEVQVDALPILHDPIRVPTIPIPGGSHMSKRLPFMALTLLAATALACSFTFELPARTGSAERGALITEDIRIPRPTADDVLLKINFAAGELNLSPGAGEALVQGTAQYDVEQLQPTVQTEDGRVVLSTGEVDNITDFDFNLDLDGVENQWELTLADDPMDLEIAGGAFSGEFDLTGLALRNLELATGASDLEVHFDEPNPVEMNQLRVNTGASQVSLHGLANAGFRRLEFQGGAGDFTLDFQGELRGDASVQAGAAMSSLRLVVPEDMNVELSVEGALAEIDLPQGFVRQGGQYIQSGPGPTLTIRVEIGAGQVTVERP